MLLRHGAARGVDNHSGGRRVPRNDISNMYDPCDIMIKHLKQHIQELKFLHQDSSGEKSKSEPSV